MMQKNKHIIKTTWYKKNKKNFIFFETVDQAKTEIGFFENNKAFMWSLASKINWELKDNIYLSYILTFDTKENVCKFIDNKHEHDKNNCYLTEGVRFEPSMGSFTYIDNNGNKFVD